MPVEEHLQRRDDDIGHRANQCGDLSDEVQCVHGGLLDLPVDVSLQFYGPLSLLT